jgi:hypothetical protein
MAAIGIKYYFRTRWLCFAVLAIMGLVSADSCLAIAPSEAQSRKASIPDPEGNFGIKIVSLRPTAGGQMLDLRFRVTDPQKAKAVLDKNNKAYLLDGKTGKTLPVPVTKAGPMRQATLNPEAGRVYFMLFSNPGGMVREGGSVSLLVGDFRKDGIVVDGSGAVPAAPDRPELP